MLTEPILYSFRRCPYAMRARMALLVSGTACEIREVMLRDKPAEMLAASPKGTVPVLVLADGSVIDESIDVMRWALARNDPEGWLAGDDAALIAANDGPFKHHLDRYKYPERHGSDPLAHRAEGTALLAALEARLANQPYLCGSRRTLADASIMPFVRQFAAVDHDWFAAQQLPALRGWLAAWIASPLFERTMVNRPQWRAGDPPVLLG
ncbi:glutathione S-transferase [Sphingomonas sp. AOB5]|uniref:glutathione S-transferase n=1 Tax=Sphingomonas sp. AOB5 TaxID=3034017 RepID=UPI0023F66422|nr:glutathione S-transferase [Sphingomonas sp. AOB5]MDF7777357.1 glutathione S-transferase [Sphingomonas sp. AOB5]